MAKLTTQARKNIPTREFAGPDRSYPIEDKAHARNALSRVSQHGSSALKAEVRAKVHHKYPAISMGKHPHHEMRQGANIHHSKGHHSK
jgi:hypothetical protein